MNQLSIVAILVVACVAIVSTQKPTAPAAPPAAVPVIVWGSCPQLEPSDSDKKSKADVLAECLKQFPIPTELTQETVNTHQKSVAECALKKENWFEKNGEYRFNKAESEIKKKKLSKNMEDELLKAHTTCRDEAKAKIADKLKVVEQVQLYQSCMDFHITKACGIKIEAPKQ